MKKYFILCFLIVACSSQKELFKDDKKNYIMQNGKSYIQVNYSNVNEIDKKSNNQFVIKNNNDKNLMLFSTIIENSSMLYSKKNLIISDEKLTFKSYYKNYMNDASNSGIKRFNFIIIKPNDSIIINIDDKIIKDEFEKIDLNYLYFYSNEKSNLIDVNNTKLEYANVSITKG